VTGKIPSDRIPARKVPAATEEAGNQTGSPLLDQTERNDQDLKKKKTGRNPAR